MLILGLKELTILINKGDSIKFMLLNLETKNPKPFFLLFL